MMFRTSSPIPFLSSWKDVIDVLLSPMYQFGHKKVSNQCIDFTLGQPIHGTRRFWEWGEASSLAKWCRPAGRQQLTIDIHRSMVGLSDDWFLFKDEAVPKKVWNWKTVWNATGNSRKRLPFYGYSLGGLHATIMPHIFHVTDLFCTVRFIS